MVPSWLHLVLAWLLVVVATIRLRLRMQRIQQGRAKAEGGTEVEFDLPPPPHLPIDTSLPQSVLRMTCNARGCHATHNLGVLSGQPRGLAATVRAICTHMSSKFSSTQVCYHRAEIHRSRRFSVASLPCGAAPTLSQRNRQLSSDFVGLYGHQYLRREAHATNHIA